VMANTDKKIDFEASLQKLETIVSKLEDENINLEDSVKSFEAGINLVKECQKQLEEAELKVKELLDDGTAQELDNS
jgi:exodeoxyribonuclease VII small subunit